MSGAPPRIATIERKTKETEIHVEINLDGSGEYEVTTGIPFFDHMLESFARHGLFDLRLRAKGDLDVDTHHTIEDVGIALGQAVKEALGTTAGVRRFGFFVLPMAESRVDVAVDVSNRSDSETELSCDRGVVEHEGYPWGALMALGVGTSAKEMYSPLVGEFAVVGGSSHSHVRVAVSIEVSWPSCIAEYTGTRVTDRALAP